jgi:hypothetical protein
MSDAVQHFAMRYLSQTVKRADLERVFHLLAEFARTHSTDDIDRLVMSGEFHMQFPDIERTPRPAELADWDDRRTARPGDPSNAILAESNLDDDKAPPVRR